MSDDIDLNVLVESFAELLLEEWPRAKAVGYAAQERVLAEDLWGMMAGLGWTALTVPEASGGLGLGLDAAAHLHAALGAAAVPSPMLGTTLAVALLTAAGTEAQQATLLPKIADGSVRVALSQPGDPRLAADGGSISGIAADVLDGPSATLLILNATRGGVPCWVLVPSDAPGVSVERQLLIDGTRTLATVSLTDVSVDDDAVILAANPAAVDDRLQRDACVVLAADALGGGEAVLALTVEYLKVREQFGKVIGSFQALKHRVADHQAVLVGSRELVMFAAGMAASHPEALLYALSAKAHVAGTVANIARDCIQLHGGVGYTAEFQPHLYLKRAKLNEALYGTQAVLLDRVVAMLEAA